MPLGGVDAVLGIQWLQTLGTYSVNHQEHFIKFKWQGERYKLYGFQPPRIANCVIPQNGEANSKRSTSICRTMPGDGIIKFISS